MYIGEKAAEAVIEALAEQVRSLKGDLWYKETKIAELEKKISELEKAKGGESDSKL